MQSFPRSKQLILYVSVVCAALTLTSCTHVPADVISQHHFPTTQSVASAPFEINSEKGQIVAHDKAGGILWTKKLAEQSDTRPPGLLYDADRVYLAYSDGVTALNARTGDFLWHSKGSARGALLSGDILLFTANVNDGATNKRERLVTALSARNGNEIFHLTLPAHEGFSLLLQELNGLFLIQEFDERYGTGDAVLIDRAGNVKRQFDRQIVGEKLISENRVLLTSTDLESLSPNGEILWTKVLAYWEPLSTGGLLELPDKSLLAQIYCPARDEGGQLIRFDPANGRIIWEDQISGLSVDHSKYNQRVTVTLRDQTIVVNGVGDAGTFDELLDLNTGKQLQRTESRRPVY